MADRPVSGSVFTLTAIAAICTAIVASTYALTDERIAANQDPSACLSGFAPMAG
jgi:Na+-translocating ferredoxin:NAD+ oxidoreductase RnfG subunit